MSHTELKQLVTAYTSGQLSFEVYRDRRRHLIDDYTGVTAPKVANKNDPLQSFPAKPDKSTAVKGKSFTSALSFKKPSTVQLVGGISLAVIGLLIILLVFDNSSETQSESELAQARLKELNAKRTANAQAQVERFLELNFWDEQSINQFVLDWQILSPDEKQLAKDTPWFNQFIAVIQKRLSEQKSIALAGDGYAKKNEDLLTTLLATIDPNYFIHNSLFASSNTLPAAKPATTSIAATQIPEQPTEVTQKPAHKPEERIEPPKPAPKVAKAKKETQPSKRPVSKPLDEKQLTNILIAFAQSFEKGDVNDLGSLFAKDAATTHHTNLQDIKSSYAELFQSTQDRNLNFNAFVWKQAGNIIEGKGKYLAKLNPKGTNIDQIFSADVTIMFDNQNKKPLIKGLYLANQHFSTSLRQTAIADKPSVTSSKEALPSNAELQQLIQQFSTYYNHGDIERLMALFSEQARTNDRTGLSGIRKDYAALFSSTKQRVILISELNWRFSEKNAVGTGLFEARVQPQSNKETKVYKGRIRISAEKSEKGVLITQMLHNTQ
ncbi:hypothetical protein [Kaarinaea lacus]